MQFWGLEIMPLHEGILAIRAITLQGLTAAIILTMSILYEFNIPILRRLIYQPYRYRK